MKIALVNPPWSFDGSIYFGCREPHLPLEYGYARALLTDAGHDAAIFDAHLQMLRDPKLRGELDAMVRDRHYSPEYAVSRTLRRSPASALYRV